MSKWYEVKVESIKIFAVEVKDEENEDEATEYALNEVSMDGDVTASAELIKSENVDSVRRHADEVLAISMED